MYNSDIVNTINIQYRPICVYLPSQIQINKRYCLSPKSIILWNLLARTIINVVQQPKKFVEATGPIYYLELWSYKFIYNILYTYSTAQRIS